MVIIAIFFISLSPQLTSLIATKLFYISGISHNDEVDTAAIAPFVKVWSELPGLFSVKSDAP